MFIFSSTVTRFSCHTPPAKPIEINIRHPDNKKSRKRQEATKKIL
jgi:hypothetical protein